jgi:pyoverdine/dityrosine biosynthesis protein Dit1
MLTLNELKEKIHEQISEYDLIDILGITTLELLEAFEDKLDGKYFQLVDELIIGEQNYDN